MRSQGLEPDAKCFCNIHELSYQTKAIGKEQYHNNFGCYSLLLYSDVRYPVPTFIEKELLFRTLSTFILVLTLTLGEVYV
jgi:hypothetical protein